MGLLYAMMIPVMKPQKKNTLTIRIGKSIPEVFAFLLDPVNSPKWVDGFIKEETSEWPVREGTVYRNLNKDGAWNEYTVTSFEHNKTFIMKMKDGNYHVQYTLASVSEAETELECIEWVIRGTLPAPFTEETLLKLKTILEQA